MSKLPETGSQKWVRNGQLAQHFNVSAMCIWRWKRDPALACPPSYEVNGIEWNDLDLWDGWMRARVVSRIGEDSKKSRRSERFKGRAARTEKVA
jgi:hypothetical protein